MFSAGQRNPDSLSALGEAPRQIFDFIAQTVKTTDGQKLILTDDEIRDKDDQCDDYATESGKKCNEEQERSRAFASLANAVALFKGGETEPGEVDEKLLADSAALFAFMIMKQTSTAGPSGFDPQTEKIATNRIWDTDYIYEAATTLFVAYLGNTHRYIDHIVKSGAMSEVLRDYFNK